MKPTPHPDQRKLTPWIPGDQKPLPDRPGLYQRKVSGIIKWARWDGAQWKLALADQTMAMRIRNPSQFQSMYTWRGLAHPPST